MNFTDPNDFIGSDIEKINAAIASATGTTNCVKIFKRRGNGADDRDFWLIDSAIFVPGNMTLIVSDCKIKLSNRCRDNFIRSANTLDPAVPRIHNVHITGEGKAVFEGADDPRSTGDAVKVLGERTYGSDTGKAGETPTGDWRNIGILLVRVSDFSLKNIEVVNSHSWAISLEYCTDGAISNLGFFSDGYMVINGKEERTLNKDGLDLRRGSRNITIENIYGATGDDLVALTSIPANIRPAGQFGEHEFLGGSENIEEEHTYNISIKNVKGYSAGHCNIVRFLNAGGIKMYNIFLDGVEDTSPEANHCGSTVRVGDTVAAWGGVAPMGDTHDITVKNVISYSKAAIFIGGSLTDSSFSNVKNLNSEGHNVFYRAGEEYIRNVTFENVTKL